MAAPRTTFPVTGPLTLVVRLGHGSVSVEARDDLTEAAVRLTPRDNDSDALDRIAVEMRGSTLAVVAPRQGGLTELFSGRRKDREAVDAVIEVPTGTRLKLTTAGDHITVAGRCGTADVTTGNATIDLDTIEGDLRLRYGNGESRVATVTGSLRLQAGRGDAHVGEVGGRLECGFGSGALVAAVVRGDLRARSGSGSAQVDAAYGDVDLATGSGSLTVGVPDGVSAHLDLLTGSGRVHSDLPVERAPRPGGRTVTLRARTGSGDVHLVRAPAA